MNEPRFRFLIFQAFDTVGSILQIGAVESAHISSFAVRLLLFALLASASLLLRHHHEINSVPLFEGDDREIELALRVAAREAGIAYDLLSAVAWQESRYNPNAVGKAGEIGMLQVMPSTMGDWAKAHQREPLSLAQFAEPEWNARVAAWYLRKGLDAYRDRDNPIPFALAYYNAGPSRVEKWATKGQTGQQFAAAIPFPSTKKYVKNVLRRL